MNLTIDLTDAGKFTIRTGGKLVPQISEWMGWRRTTSGDYEAQAWSSSVLSVKPGPGAVVSWTPGAAQVRDRLLRELATARKALEIDWTHPTYPTARKARKHQLQAIQAIPSMGHRVLLTDEMGLGKTSTALWAAHASGMPNILVVCPVSVKFNWANEIRETIGDRWSVHVINGSAEKRADQIAEAKASRGNTAVIINYDLLLHLSKEQAEWLQDFARQSFLLFDESHYLKSRMAKRTIEAQKLAEKAVATTCLTGTPVRNTIEDLFTQASLVRPGTWTSYRDFAKRYLVTQAVKFGKRTVQKVVGSKNVSELNAVLATLQIRRLKADVLDLPPKVYTYPEIELEGDLRKLYKAMKEFAKMELSKLAVGAPVNIFDPRAKSAVEQAMRCEQIAQGFVGGIPEPVMAALGSDVLKHAEKVPGRPHELVFPHAPKLIWLLETIESVVAQGGAPIVFSRFNAPMFWLEEKLRNMGLLAETLHGGLTAAGKEGVVQSFQHGVSKVLIAQVKMAEGWNAFRSQDVLFLGRDWSPAINAQAEDRTHRMGQKGTVNVQIPVVTKTIEAMIHRRLLDKASDAQQALRSVTIEELMEAL